MVIQRHKPFVLRGTANAGSSITARLGRERLRTTAAEDGSWQVTTESPWNWADTLCVSVLVDTLQF